MFSDDFDPPGFSRFNKVFVLLVDDVQNSHSHFEILGLYATKELAIQIGLEPHLKKFSDENKPAYKIVEYEVQ